MPTVKPFELALRAYNVGFGDCFLLTFRYSGKTGERHVLIDFGSTAGPKDAAGGLMKRIAEDIAARCGGKLHAIVATHRHEDHISGFATNAKGTAPGDLIKTLNPNVVVQPWTEHPDANPTTGEVKTGPQAFAARLNAMHDVSAAVLTEINQHKGFMSRLLHRQLSFLGEDNIANKAAVVNLMEMGRRGKAVYVNFGGKSGLEKTLPGVKIRVLGPPNLQQSEAIRKQKEKDDAEFWHFQAQAGNLIAQRKFSLFQNAKTSSSNNAPPHTRWFIKKLRRIRGEQLLGIMRALDEAMNNTSLILLFEAGDKKLLFPGDAQIENWSHALSKPEIRDLLADVNLYKVGHHGSLNATPKTLWNLFSHKSTEDSPDRLQSVVSTKPGKHGSTGSKTEVPRRTLIDALETQTTFFSTEEIKKNELFHEMIIKL